MAATPIFAVELFRYRGAAKDGGTLEYVFEAGEQNSPYAITKEKAAEIAADYMTTFYHVQVGYWKRKNFGQFLLCSGSFPSQTQSKDRCQMHFVVLLPDGTVVEPKVEKR